MYCSTRYTACFCMSQNYDFSKLVLTVLLILIVWRGNVARPTGSGAYSLSRRYPGVSLEAERHHQLYQLRPHLCSVCGKGFPTVTMLKQHSAVHTGERNYACKPCHKTFTQASGLWKHNQKYHHGSNRADKREGSHTSDAKSS